MSYRIMQEGRDMMHERGGEPMKLKKYIAGIYSMLEEMEECLEDMEGSYGERGGMGGDEREAYGERYPERGGYGYGERRSRMTGRYIRG